MSDSAIDKDFDDERRFVHNESKFHLLEYDEVLLSRVVVGLDPMEQLNFALGSKTLRNVFKQHKKEIGMIWVQIQEDTCVFELHCDTGIVDWNIKTTEDVFFGNEDECDSDFLELDGLKMENKRELNMGCLDRYIINTLCEDDLSACMKILDVMLDLWVPKELTFHVWRRHNIRSLVKNDRLNHCDKLIFTVLFKVSDEEFLLFRENIRPKKDLIVMFTGYKNQNHRSIMPLEYDKLEILGAEWMNKEDLFNINCCAVRLRKPNLKDEDWNEFFKGYMSENNKKLKMMSIESPGCDRAKILDGIETKTLDDIRAHLNLPNYTFEFRDFDGREYNGSLGHHWIRPDGTIATLYLHNRGALLDAIYFLVWDESNPKRIHPDELPVVELNDLLVEYG